MSNSREQFDLVTPTLLTVRVLMHVYINVGVHVYVCLNLGDVVPLGSSPDLTEIAGDGRGKWESYL